MKSKYFLLTLLILLSLKSYGEVDIEQSDLGVSTKIAPEYFGPNALPIVDMLDGRVSSRYIADLGGNYFDGHRGDKTYDLNFKLTVPLFSSRVNVCVWFQSVVEWYQMSELSRSYSRVSEDEPNSGTLTGDAYLSTDIQILKQQLNRPDISLRIGLKTAMGGGFTAARYFDNPGYFFDTSLGKSFELKGNFFNEIRLAASAGFLCWQTDNGRQNDAVMYGARIKLDTKYFALSTTFGGYIGWENDGDRPMSIKTRLSKKIKNFEPYFFHQFGIEDYPFTQYKVGLCYYFWGYN